MGGRALKGSFIEPVELCRSVRTEESLGPIITGPIEPLEPFKAPIVELRPVVAIGSGDSGDWGIAARARARAVCGATGVAWAACSTCTVARAPCIASEDALLCCMLPKTGLNCATARSCTGLKFGSLVMLDNGQV